MFGLWWVLVACGGPSELPRPNDPPSWPMRDLRQPSTAADEPVEAEGQDAPALDVAEKDGPATEAAEQPVASENKPPDDPARPASADSNSKAAPAPVTTPETPKQETAPSNP